MKQTAESKTAKAKNKTALARKKTTLNAMQKVNIKADGVERVEVNDQMRFFFMNPDTERDYSNTIELYDFIPKYFWGKAERIQGKFLEPLEREFGHHKERYRVRITPARIKDDDTTSRDYFPGKREELVEDALRKLATEGQGFMMDGQAGVHFTLYQLIQELRRTGHIISLVQVKEALMVCVGTSIQLTDEKGQAVFVSNLFEAVGLQTKEEWEGQGEKTRAYIKFNWLITESIRTQTFRQFNYEVSMSYQNIIARQLHKRMSHHYKQASLNTPYSIKLSTIIENFGLTAYEKISNNLRDVKKALNEMIEKDVVLNYQTEKFFDQVRQNKISDIKITLYPHQKFIDDVIAANSKQRQIARA